MAKTTTVPKELVPYEAGVVILTPLDRNHRPQYEHAVATQKNFLQSTQLTETVTTEELENGNGQSKTLVTQRVQNLAVTSNVTNIVFHNMAVGNLESLPERSLMMTETTWNLPTTTSEGLTITFGAEGDIKKEPAPNNDGEYFMIVGDSYDNPLVRRDTPENGAYTWDADTKTIGFSDDYAGQQIRIIYEYEVTNAIRYDSNPVLSQKEFQIDVFGDTVDASTNRKIRKHECLKRATLTGDVPGMPTQKSRATSLVYNFQSAPVPAGESPYYAEWVPMDDDEDATGGYADNIVNGGDDVFTGKP